MADEAEVLRGQLAQLQTQQVQAELDVKGLTLANTGATLIQLLDSRQPGTQAQPNSVSPPPQRLSRACIATTEPFLDYASAEQATQSCTSCM